MELTRRGFVTKVAVGIASLPFMKGLSSAQVRGELGDMKIVDTAAMFAERSHRCPKTEIASLLSAPRNDSLVSSAPLFVQSFVSRS